MASRYVLILDIVSQVETEVFTVQSNSVVAFTFDPQLAKFSRKGAALCIQPEGGALIVLSNFFDLEKDVMPYFLLPDSQEVPALAFLQHIAPGLMMEKECPPEKPQFVTLDLEDLAWDTVGAEAAILFTATGKKEWRVPKALSGAVNKDN